MDVETMSDTEDSPRKPRERHNWKLITGISILATLFVLSLAGFLLYDTATAKALSAPPELPPMWVQGGSAAHPLGTESLGRDLLALTIRGVPTSLWVGVLAAGISVTIAIILGFTAGLKGGTIDEVIRIASDSTVQIPTFAVLVVFAAYLDNLSITAMAILLSIFGWAWPTRTIRAQVLSMRERGYVKLARLMGRSTPGVMFGEMMPNLLPYLAASFFGSVSGAILAATSLEALGLGPTRIPSLGSTLSNALESSAILRGMYWWWGPPVFVLVTIFVSLFLIVVGLDEYVNPRLKMARTSRKRSAVSDRTIDQQEAAMEVAIPKAFLHGAGDGNPILKVSDLHIEYELPDRVVEAVRGVNLSVYRGDALALVGESGCGKSTIAMAMLGLVTPPGRFAGGSVFVNDADITRLEGERLRKVRWAQVSLVSQGAMNSLNPVMRVGEQIAEVIEAHEQVKRRLIEERIRDLFDVVGLPRGSASRYPHELSGGMKQRAAIAMAIALSPDLIVADEPTSALDVVNQRLVMQTLMDVRERLDTSLVIAGHDIALLTQVVDHMAVMRAGRIVEFAATAELLANPLHPYTRLLIDSVPVMNGKPRSNVRIGPALAPDRPERAAADDDDARIRRLEREDEERLPLLELAPDHFAAVGSGDV